MRKVLIIIGLVLCLSLSGCAIVQIQGGVGSSSYGDAD